MTRRLAGDGRFDRAAILRVFAAWAVLAAILLVAGRHAIATRDFPDPDDVLRLVQVRDLLAGQNWFDMHQYRVAAPEGVPMHWSRLVDIPIAGVILALRPLLGAAGAEMAAVVIVPLLTLLCVLLLVGRLAARLFDAEVTAIACLVTAIAGPALFQLLPLRIDHHGWQIVFALVAYNGLTADSARRGGWVIGLALSAQLAISLEGLPLAGLFMGICALRGLRDPASRHAWLAHASAAFALGSIALFLATRGLFDLAEHCDAVSPAHLMAFTFAALGAQALQGTARRPLALQIGILGITGAGAMAILLTAAPQCGMGAFAELDPVVRKFWYNAVVEGLPVWHVRIGTATTMVCVPLFGILASLWHRHRAATPALRMLWLDLILVQAGAYAIGIMVARASAVACVFAAVPTAALVRDWIVWLRDRPTAQRLAGFGAIALVLLPSLPVVAWVLLAPDHGNERAGNRVTRCNYAAAGKALDALPATDLFAPLDIGPNLIMLSHHRVVATGHHRGMAAMRDVIDMFMATPDKARAIVHRRHATLVVLCPDLTEPRLYARAAPNGMAALLLKGKAPAWLEPVDPAPGTYLKFWRVVD